MGKRRAGLAREVRVLVPQLQAEERRRLERGLQLDVRVRQDVRAQAREAGAAGGRDRMGQEEVALGLRAKILLEEGLEAGEGAAVRRGVAGDEAVIATGIERHADEVLAGVVADAGQALHVLQLVASPFGSGHEQGVPRGADVEGGVLDQREELRRHGGADRRPKVAETVAELEAAGDAVGLRDLRDRVHFAAEEDLRHARAAARQHLPIDAVAGIVEPVEEILPATRVHVPRAVVRRLDRDAGPGELGENLVLDPLPVRQIGEVVGQLVDEDVVDVGELGARRRVIAGDDEVEPHRLHGLQHRPIGHPRLAFVVGALRVIVDVAVDPTGAELRHRLGGVVHAQRIGEEPGVVVRVITLTDLPEERVGIERNDMGAGLRRQRVELGRAV